MTTATEERLEQERYEQARYLKANRIKERRLNAQRDQESWEAQSQDIVLWAQNNFYAEATVDRPVGIINLMPHQKAVLRYAFQQRDNRFQFQTILYSTTKKGGKTAIGGLVGRWAAECWGNNGDIYFVGNDANQAKEKGFAALRTSIELHPDYHRGKQELPGKWSIRDTRARYTPNGSRVHAVALDYKGEAGSNPVVSVWTELWGFTDKAAKRFWAEMAPAPTRPNSLRFIETYAGFVGESELLEGLYENVVEKGRQLRVQDLMDAVGKNYEHGCFVEAPNPDSLIPCYVNEAAGIFAYWDSGEVARRMPWQQGAHGANYYRSEAAIQTDSQYRRLHLNEWVSAESEFIPIELWDACLNPLPLVPGEKTPIVVSLDAAVTGDCFGLAVVSRDPDNPVENIAVRLTKKWTPPEGGKLDYEQPGAVLRWLAENFNIVQVCYDPFQLEYFVKKYREELGLWFEDFNQGQRRLMSDKQLYDLIVHKRLRHDGDPDLRQHIQNCNAKTQKDEDGKLRLVKKSESRKIDLAVALSMASAECLRLNL